MYIGMMLDIKPATMGILSLLGLKTVPAIRDEMPKMAPLCTSRPDEPWKSNKAPSEVSTGVNMEKNDKNFRGCIKSAKSAGDDGELNEGLNVAEIKMPRIKLWRLPFLRLPDSGTSWSPMWTVYTSRQIPSRHRCLCRSGAASGLC